MNFIEVITVDDVPVLLNLETVELVAMYETGHVQIDLISDASIFVKNMTYNEFKEKLLAMGDL